MEKTDITELLRLDDIKDLHLEGMNKAFSLGNPWYGKHSEDGKYHRKYLPSGEVYRVLIETRYDEQGYPIEIIDVWSERIK